MKPRLLSVLLLIVLTGCAVGPDYQRPALNLPTQWPAEVRLSMEQRQSWASWWTRYNDPVLNRLVDSALSDNLDIGLAAARVRQARAVLGLSRAREYPTLDARVRSARSEASTLTQPLSGTGAQDSYHVAAVLGYEVDLWGRLDRATEAAQARLLQSQFSQDAVRLAVITDTVTTYFDWRGAQSRIRITRDAIDAREQAYELERVRFKHGFSPELVLRQAEAELENARAQLPELEAEAQRLWRALAILTGRPASALLEPVALPSAPLAEINYATALPAFMPSRLLERRPDIRAAEAALIGANADIGVAKAAWYPQVNLSLAIGSEALDIGDLFSDPAALWQLGASVVAPLLDFGRRSAQVDSAQALHDAAELQYRATVRNAFVDVGNALTLLETANDRLVVRSREVEALRRAVELAQTRYAAGSIGYLPVLDARRALYRSQLARTDAVRDRLVAATTLFKALGGGWQASAAENKQA